MTLRCLVVDDSALFRRVLTETLSSLSGVEVIGSASNGKQALEKIGTLQPDLVTLDIDMPGMDGLAVLEQIKVRDRVPETIVVSAMSRRGGDLTVRALERGAIDFIVKPDAVSSEQSSALLKRELAPLVSAISHRVEIKRILGNRRALSATASVAGDRPAVSSSLHDVTHRMQKLRLHTRPEMVLIGVSTGGPLALTTLLPALPSNLGVPVLIVQHMPPVFTQSLAEDLNARCSLRVSEATHGETPEPNKIYIAPGGQHMRLGVVAGGSPILQITSDPPENNCRPAVDYLFRSAANNFPGRSMAVILTGMGSDGTLGLKLLKRHGCFAIAQDEATSVIYGMPKAAFDAGVTDLVLPLSGIASAITSMVRTGQP